MVIGYKVAYYIVYHLSYFGSTWWLRLVVKCIPGLMNVDVVKNRMRLTVVDFIHLDIIYCLQIYPLVYPLPLIVSDHFLCYS